MAIREILNIARIGRTGPEFRAELIRMADRLRLNPSFIAAVMSVESGFDPQAVNPSGGATGLIQFMPATARLLGTTTDQLRGMTDIQQLVYVEKFYSPFAGRLQNVGSYYMATFLPVHVNAPRDKILASAGEKIYDQNKGLDRDKDGILTAGDVYRVVENVVANANTRPPIQVDMSVLPPSNTGGLIALVVIGGLGYAAYKYGLL